MDEALFIKLLEKLEKLTLSLEKSISSQNAPMTKEQKEDFSNVFKDALNQDKNDTKFQGTEKRRIQKIAKVFKAEFKDLFENVKKSDKQEVGKKDSIVVSLDRKTFRGIESTLKKVIPDFADAIKDKIKIPSQKKGGVFGFLGDIIGGAFGFLGSFNKLIPLLLTAGGIALAFYVVKNIEKIANAIDKVLKSGKENLPDILLAMKDNLFPFWDDFTTTATMFFDRSLDTLDTLIKQVPNLFDILLKNIPVLRAEFTGFLNDMNDLGNKLSQNDFWKNFLFLFSLSLPVGLIAAIVAITKPLRVLNAAATAILVSSLAYYFSSFKDLENINWATLGKAGVSLGLLYGVLFFTAKGMPNANMVAKMLTVGGAAAGTVLYLQQLGNVLKEWNDINWETLAKAGATITGLFAAIAAAGAIGTAGAVPALVALGVGLAAAGTAMLAIRGIGESLRPVISVYRELSDVFQSYTTIDGSKLVGVAGGITALAAALTLQSVTGGVNTVVNSFTNLWSKLTGQKSPLEKLKEFEALNGEKLDRNAEAIKKLFKALEAGGTEEIKKAIKNLNEFRLIKEAGSAQIQTTTIRPAQNRVAQDFILRPNQPPVMFSSEDNILAFKNVKFFNPIKDQIAESYNNVEKMFKMLLDEQKKGTFESNNETKRQTSILEKIATLNQQLTEEGNNVSMVNTAVNNNLINVDTYTSTSFRNRVGIHGPTVYA